MPISQYFTDVENGTLPQVAFIETGVEVSETEGTSSLDEHPESNIQKGAAYVAKLMNALMQSPSWKDSAFILTYDEGGGLYDHVPPQAAVVPDSDPAEFAADRRCGYVLPYRVQGSGDRRSHPSRSPATSRTR